MFLELNSKIVSGFLNNLLSLRSTHLPRFLLLKQCFVEMLTFWRLTNTQKKRNFGRKKLFKARWSFQESVLCVICIRTFFLCLAIILFTWKRQRKRDISIHCFPKSPQPPGLGQPEARNSKPGLPRGWQGSSIWSFTCCLPGALPGSWMGSRGGTRSQHSDMGSGHPKWWLNPCTHCPLSGIFSSTVSAREDSSLPV